MYFIVHSQKITQNKLCCFGLINGTGFKINSTVYKPSQITLNSVQSELINVVMEEAMDSTLVKTNYVKNAICFRSYSHTMTGKPKGDQKPPQTGTTPVVQSSLPGATTTPSPPAKPTPSPPGAPTKAPTPRKSTGGSKVKSQEVNSKSTKVSRINPRVRILSQKPKWRIRQSRGTRKGKRRSTCRRTYSGGHRPPYELLWRVQSPREW